MTETNKSAWITQKGLRTFWKNALKGETTDSTIVESLERGA